VLTLVSRILSGRGYEVVSAMSAADASAVSEAPGTAPFDLILTDVVLPGSRGPELAARVRRTWKDARVVYMSGYDREAVARHGVAAEDHFLPKPFTPRSLRDALERAMPAPDAS
jgi:CheY-like chemotaxis protein